MLQSLTTMYPLETCSIREGFSQSPEDHLYIRVSHSKGVDLVM